MLLSVAAAAILGVAVRPAVVGREGRPLRRMPSQTAQHSTYVHTVLISSSKPREERPGGERASGPTQGPSQRKTA